MANQKGKLKAIGIGALLGAGSSGFALYHFGFEDLEKGGILVGACALLGILLSLRIAQGRSAPANTVIYTLIHKGRIVYIGITYDYRLGSRIDEHRRSGKVFDRIDFTKSLPREQALRMEAQRIRKDKPKYNVMHA